MSSGRTRIGRPSDREGRRPDDPGGRHAQSHVEGSYLLRPGDDPRERLPGHRGEDASFQPAARRGRRADPHEARVLDRRGRGRLRAHREGLRVREGPLRDPHRRRLRGDPGGILPSDRHPAVRRARGDRPDAVQEVLLPGARRDRRQGVRAAARSAQPFRQGRDRQGQLPRQGAPRGTPLPRRGLRPGDHVLAGRDPRSGLRRRRRLGEDPAERAGDGPDADRQPHGGLGSHRVQGRVPRGHAPDRRGQDQRRGDRDRRGRAHGQGRRPDGGAEGLGGRRQEGAQGRAGAQEEGRRRRPSAKKPAPRKKAVGE